MPNAFTKAEWNAYYSRKRIVQQWMQLHLLGTIDCAKILEVGPALGLVTSLLVNVGYEVHTLDRVPRAFDYPDVPHLEKDICELRGEEIAGYDAIFCCETLEHIDWRQVGTVLSTFRASGAEVSDRFGPLYGVPAIARPVSEPDHVPPIFLDEEIVVAEEILRPSRRAAISGKSATGITRCASGRGRLESSGWSIVKRDFTEHCRSVFHVLKASERPVVCSGVQQRQKPRRGGDVGGERRGGGGLLGILAPGLDLKAFVELRGGEGLGRIETALDQRQRDDQRAAGARSPRVTPSARNRRARRPRRQRRAGSRPAGRRDDPGGDLERRVVAQHRPVDQRLPHRLLARRQRRRMRRAIADEIGRGVVGHLPHDRLALRRHPVDRGAGQTGQRHRPPGGSRPPEPPTRRRSPPPAPRSARSARALPGS